MYCYKYMDDECVFYIVTHRHCIAYYEIETELTSATTLLLNNGAIYRRHGECIKKLDPHLRFLPTLMMAAVLHPGGVRCELVHVFNTEVQGEHHDGRSEAGEGVLPQVIEERVSSPSVLSSEYHCAVFILLHDISMPIQSETRQEITHDNL